MTYYIISSVVDHPLGEYSKEADAIRHALIACDRVDLTIDIEMGDEDYRETIGLVLYNGTQPCLFRRHAYNDVKIGGFDVTNSS